MLWAVDVSHFKPYNTSLLFTIKKSGYLVSHSRQKNEQTHYNASKKTEWIV